MNKITKKIIEHKKYIVAFLLSLLFTFAYALFIYNPKFSNKTTINVAKTFTPRQSSTTEIANFLSSPIFKSTNTDNKKYEMVVQQKNSSEIYIVITSNSILETNNSRDLEISKILTYLEESRQGLIFSITNQIKIKSKNINSLVKYYGNEDLVKFKSLKDLIILMNYYEMIEKLSIDLNNLEVEKKSLLLNNAFISNSTSTTISAQSVLRYLIVFNIIFLVIYSLNQIILYIKRVRQ